MFLSLLNIKELFKQFNLFAPTAKTFFLTGLKFWFFVFRGKGKGGKRTYVLQETKGAFLSGLFDSHFLWEEGRGDVDHHTGEGKEEGIKEEGEIREGGVKEEREGEAIFVVREDGKSWVYKNILLEHWGTSGYVVSIKGIQEGWEGRDTIVCYVPNIITMLDFLKFLTKGRRPLFTSIAEFTPLC